MSWAVIFDVDGTMVDNVLYHERAWIELGRRYGFGITSEFYREKIHSKSNDKNVRTLIPGASIEQINSIAEEKEVIYRESYRPYIREIAGLRVLLESLFEAGVLMSAASNSPKGNVDMVIDELGIRDYFCTVIDRDQVSRGKPDPELFLRASEGMGVESERCVVFEDSISGFGAARAAGMGFIAITDGADNESLSGNEGALGVYRNFEGITVDLIAECGGFI